MMQNFIIFKNNDQINETLKSTKCVHEAIENCTPEAVQSFLENITVDFETCLSDVSCIVFTVTMVVTWLDPKSNCTYSSNVYLRLPGSAPKLSLVFQQMKYYSAYFESENLENHRI